MTRQKNNIITPISLILFLGSVVYLSVEIGHNNKLEEGLKNERLHSESMLSEKLLLEKEIHKKKTELKELSEAKENLERQLEKTESDFNYSDRELKNLNGIKNLAQHLEKKNKELLNQNSALENELHANNQNLQATQASGDDLQLAITLLQQQHEDLLNEVRAWRLSSMNLSLIEASNKNSKLIGKAKKLKKLKVSVDMNAELEKLSFKIVDSSGREFNNQDETVLIRTGSSANQLHRPFYLGSSVEEPIYKRVEMVYSPKQKLESGLYTIKVLSDSELIGSLQVKLR